MSEKNQSNSNISQQPQVQSQVSKPASPNPSVQAPQNVLITEGYEPPKSQAK
jgi:hypothetical protein